MTRQHFPSVKSLLSVICYLLLLTPAFAADNTVTAYVALDREFSTPILDQFTKESGIKVLPVFDVEVSKTVGLVNRIIAEKNRPLCDVFWNNELLQTLRLKAGGALETYDSPSAKDIPDPFRDPEKIWNGFAARARVIIYNTNLIQQSEVPLSLLDWGKSPAHKGRFAIANAHFGTTSTHLAALVSVLGEKESAAMVAQWKAASVAVLAGNATVRNEVAAGRYAFGLTDTDDAFAALDEKKPVGILYPKEGLLIPNSVALIKNAPHPETAKKLIDFILRKETEKALAASSSGQIPLRADVERPKRVPDPNAVNSMAVEWPKVLEAIPAATKLADQLQ